MVDDSLVRVTRAVFGAPESTEGHFYDLTLAIPGDVETFTGSPLWVGYFARACARQNATHFSISSGLTVGSPGSLGDAGPPNAVYMTHG